MNWGVFKRRHKGYGIYWRGSYNVEGDGCYRTLGEAVEAIEGHLAERAEREQREQSERLKAGNVMRAHRSGDIVTVHTPDGALTMDIRQYRREVFQIQDKYDMDIVLMQ